MHDNDGGSGRSDVSAHETRAAGESAVETPTDGESARGSWIAPTSRRGFVKAAGVGAVGLGASQAIGLGGAQATTSYNLAEALQKSLHFYDANMCGEDVSEQSRLIWRGDCHDEHDTAVPLAEPIENNGTNLPQSFIDQYSDVLDPDGTGTVDLSGGYHDAGDHPKFGCPEGYAASTLGWAVHEFEQAFRDTGSYQHVLTHLRRFAEYFIKCTFRDSGGSVVTFCHQVGNGGSEFDHNYWGPAELQTTDVSTRPAYFAIPSDQAGAATGQAAAALALASIIFESEDSTFAAECLDNARALYDFAVANPGVTDYSAPYYDPSGSADELCWAAIWLHVATGEQAYMDDVLGEDSSGNFSGHVSEIITSRSDSWQNRWVHSWDSVWGGVLLKIAQLTDDDYFWDRTYWHLAWWSGGEVAHQSGNSDGYISTTPAGFSWLDQWGSARYNAAAQMTAMVYHKYRDDQAIADWALGQMEYIMGDNPFGYSLIVGFTDDHAEHPHHDTAHGSITGSLDEPPNHRHTLWGALVGGPDNSDNHNDATDDYTLNEVAIDFNAGCVGALAGLYSAFADADDEPVSGFLSTQGDVDPYSVEAAVSSESDSRIDYTAFVHNMSFHPAQYEDGLSFRYFFDVSGLEANGGTVDDVTVDITYDQVGSELDGSVSVVGPEPWDADAGIYYVEFDYSGATVHGRYELSFALSEYTIGGLNPSNDPSREGITSSQSTAQYMPVYVDGQHVFGTLPDGTTPPDDGGDGTPTGTETPVGTEPSCSGTDAPAQVAGATPHDLDGDGLYMDVNGNCRLDNDDVVTYFEEMDSAGITENVGAYDYNGNGRIDFDDLVTLFESL